MTEKLKSITFFQSHFYGPSDTSIHGELFIDALCACTSSKSMCCFSRAEHLNDVRSIKQEPLHLVKSEAPSDVADGSQRPAIDRPSVCVADRNQRQLVGRMKNIPHF